MISVPRKSNNENQDALAGVSIGGQSWLTGRDFRILNGDIVTVERQ